MKQRILVINPNSTQTVTDHMNSALEGFRFRDGPEIVCETLRSGPPGIETQAHVDGATRNLLEYFEAAQKRQRPDAVVVGCFSDPGLVALRETLGRPVYGMGACSYLTAAALGERFGVISVVSSAIARHKRYIRSLGLDHKLAGDIAVDMSVVELSKESIAWKRMAATGRVLRDEHGADVVIMGCAGMSRYRNRLEDHLGIAVIDPVQAAVGMAMGALLGRRSTTGTARAAA
jgi:allantoin racemase